MAACRLLIGQKTIYQTSLNATNLQLLDHIRSCTESQRFTPFPPFPPRCLPRSMVCRSRLACARSKPACIATEKRLKYDKRESNLSSSWDQFQLAYQGRSVSKGASDGHADLPNQPLLVRKMSTFHSLSAKRSVLAHVIVSVPSRPELRILDPDQKLL